MSLNKSVSNKMSRTIREQVELPSSIYLAIGASFLLSALSLAYTAGILSQRVATIEQSGVVSQIPTITTELKSINSRLSNIEQTQNILLSTAAAKR